MTFTVACKVFFGQRLLDFAKEIRLLTPKDKQELAPLLSKKLKTEVTLI